MLQGRLRVKFKQCKFNITDLDINEKNVITCSILFKPQSGPVMHEMH